MGNSGSGDGRRQGEHGSTTKKFYIADTFTKYLSVFHCLKVTITDALTSNW